MPMQLTYCQEESISTDSIIFKVVPLIPVLLHELAPAHALQCISQKLDSEYNSFDQTDLITSH